jgi:hypothetical protein
VILSFFQSLAVWIFGILYSIILLSLIRNTWFSEGRKKSLLPVFLLNLILFYPSLIIVYFSLQIQPSLTSFLIIFGLFTIGLYVGSIEVPGFLILTKYDEKSNDILNIVQRNIISSNYDFSVSIRILENSLTSNKIRLEETYLYDSLNYFVKSSKDMNNVDGSVFNLILMETNQSIRNVSDMSKHPFPKLVEVFSLAGLSFLIAQLLK